MDAIGSIAGLFSKLAPVIGGGLGVSGLIGNILTEKARSNELGYLNAQQKAIPDATGLAKQVAAATQPLSTGLIQGVENTVGSNLAAQGLAQAPGIQAAAESQALAPYIQNNQQQALQLVMARLGLPLQYAQTYLQNLPGQTNLSPLLALLMKQQPGGGADLSQIIRMTNPEAVSGPYATTGSDLSGQTLTPPDFGTPPIVPEQGTFGI